MKKLLILDLDETLIHTEKFPTNYLEEGEYDFKYPSSNKSYEYFTIKRPFLDEFLKYAFENFDVAVWTAAGKEYAENVVKNIGIDKSNLEFFYTEENCTIRLDYLTGDYYGEKNLNKIKKRGFDLEKVLIVDDIAKTAVHNYGNLIQIKPFTSNREDTELLKLISYLEKIKDAERFRSIEKRGWSSN
jgi:Dullard-like phosphatase family protein